jgi:hypothetical protein
MPSAASPGRNSAATAVVAPSAEADATDTVEIMVRDAEIMIVHRKRESGDGRASGLGDERRRYSIVASV